MNLISKHLDRNNLKIEIFKIDSICAFTGEKITEGVTMSDLIKETFTDREYIRYKSKYASISAALLIEAVIPSEKGFNSMRNYSYYADENELRILKREDIIDILLDIPRTPFQFGVTYNNKKHTTYKAPINYNTNRFQVITDLGIVNFDFETALEIKNIAQKWYTVIPGKRETEAKPTFFTKDNIKGLSIPQQKQIQEYGIKKYFSENAVLEKHRNTALFNLIIHTLNKQL